MKISLIVSLLFTIGIFSESNMMALDNRKASSNGAYLMNIIRNILNDPYFMALDRHQKLKLLFVIYDVLVDNYKT